MGNNQASPPDTSNNSVIQTFQASATSSSNQSTEDSLKKSEGNKQNNSNKRNVPPRFREKKDPLDRPGKTQPYTAGSNSQSPPNKVMAGQSYTRSPQKMGGKQNTGRLQLVESPQNVNPPSNSASLVYLTMPPMPVISNCPPPNMNGTKTLMNPHMIPVNCAPSPHMVATYPRVPSPQDYTGPLLTYQNPVSPPAIDHIPPLMASNHLPSRFGNQRGRQWNPKPGPAKFNKNLKITNDFDAMKSSPASTSENKTSNLGKDSSDEKNCSEGKKDKSGSTTDLWKQLDDLKIKIEKKDSSMKELCTEISDMMIKVPTTTMTSKEIFIKELSECLRQVNKTFKEEEIEDSARNPRRNYKTNFKNYNNSGGCSSSRGRGGFKGNYNNRRPQGPDGEDGASNRNRPYSHHRFHHENTDKANEQCDDDNCSDVASQNSETSSNRGKGGNYRGRAFNRRGGYQRFRRDQDNNEKSDDGNASDDAASMCSEPPNNIRRKGGNFRGNNSHRRGGHQNYGRDYGNNGSRVPRWHHYSKRNQDKKGVEGNDEQSDDDNNSDDAASMCSEPPNDNRWRGGRGKFRGRGNWRGQGKRRGNSHSGNMHKATSKDALSQENDDKKKEDGNDQNQQEEKLISFESDDDASIENEDDDSYASDGIMNLFIGKEIPSLMDAILAKINVMLKVKNCIMIAHVEEKGIVKEKPETILDIIQFKQTYQDGVVLNEE